MAATAMRALGALLACVFALSAAPAAAADGQPPVQVRETEEGAIFTNSAGMTLYVFALENATPGKSKCYDKRYTIQSGRQFGTIPLPAPDTRKTCVQKWPPFLAAEDAKASGDWSLIVREGGARQWAYQGHLLYTSIKDRKPGDVNGEAINERERSAWMAAMAPLDFPPGFKLLRREEGLVLATADGRPAYVRRGGRLQRTSSQFSELLQPIAAPSFGRISGKWGIVDAGGLKQYAFNGEPLYVLPDGYTDADVENEGGWATAVYRRATPIPPQIHTRTTIVGKIYTTENGMSLYSFSCLESGAPDYLSCDDPGDAAVYWSALCGDAKECSRRWRPYRPTANARPSGEWTIQEVSDPLFIDPAGATALPGTPKVKVWAYRGRPMYTFVDDDEPGQILGHDINYFARSSFTAVRVPGPGLY